MIVESWTIPQVLAVAGGLFIAFGAGLLALSARPSRSQLSRVRTPRELARRQSSGSLRAMPRAPSDSGRSARVVYHPDGEVERILTRDTDSILARDGSTSVDSDESA